jgi:hypothetical protein
MEHAIARIEAGLRWHDAVLDLIGKPGCRGRLDAARSPADSPGNRNETGRGR